MKNLKFTAFIFIGILGIASCKSKKQDNKVTNNMKGTAFSLEEIQTQAALDPNFKKTAMYRSYMEKAAIELSKKNYQLNNRKELLQDFENALKNLRASTDKIKQNPDLAKDQQFITLVQFKAERVREYQQLLKKLPLNLYEMEQYEKLCRF